MAVRQIPQLRNCGMSSGRGPSQRAASRGLCPCAARPAWCARRVEQGRQPWCRPRLAPRADRARARRPRPRRPLLHACPNASLARRARPQTLHLRRRLPERAETCRALRRVRQRTCPHSPFANGRESRADRRVRCPGNARRGVPGLARASSPPERDRANSFGRAHHPSGVTKFRNFVTPLPRRSRGLLGSPLYIGVVSVYEERPLVARGASHEAAGYGCHYHTRRLPNETRRTGTGTCPHAPVLCHVRAARPLNR